MTRFGGVEVPSELLDRAHAAGLLRAYLERTDGDRLVFSGAAFDTYPDPLGSDAWDRITDTDLVSVAMLSIRVTGQEALFIRQHHAEKIRELLASIPPQARIEDDRADLYWRKPDGPGPALELWELLRTIIGPREEKHLGPVAAGKLLARKRPNLIPIWDSMVSSAFRRPYRDDRWWDDVRSAALDTRPAVDGMTLWAYLASLREVPGAGHLPVLRVLDILGWMYGSNYPGLADTTR